MAGFITVEPRFNEPLYSDVLGITNDFLYPTLGTRGFSRVWRKFSVLAEGPHIAASARVTIACVASVSNRVIIARKLEREQKKKVAPPPPPSFLFFALVPTFFLSFARKRLLRRLGSP